MPDTEAGESPEPRGSGLQCAGLRGHTAMASTCGAPEAGENKLTKCKRQVMSGGPVNGALRVPEIVSF